MNGSDPLYAYRLEPLEKAAIWGGDALVKRYGKHADPAAPIGESWECWDANRVANGTLRGKTLGELRSLLGTNLMGPIDTTQIFPVLTKIIDAQLALSVQVHPDDAYAQRVEHQANGKTECWYILSARPGAQLVLGWTRDTDRAEYEKRVADGSLGDILRRVPVRAGQTYYLPAGTLHAIGEGIELFEAQQASDLTYRIFDWNRLDTAGQPRELHVAKAGDVLDFRATNRSAVTTIGFPAGALERTLLVGDRRFVMELVRAHAADLPIATYELPVTVTALGAPLEIEMAGLRTAVEPYGTVVIPAAGVHPVLRSNGEMLIVRPQPKVDRIREDALRGGVSAESADAFFKQFP